MPKEKDLKRDCVKLIKDRGGWARSIPSGPLGAGFPDFMFFYRGYGGGLETKLPGKEKTLTKIQANTLKEIKNNGGIAMVITDKRQVTAILNAIDRKKDG
jgi:hypothetical protein